MTNRRDFLKTASLLGFGAAAPSFLARTAYAVDSQAKGKDTILVVVQLTGGNDGLNTVIPFKNDLYKQYRPTIALPQNSVLKLNDDVALHPAMKALHGLLDDKALCVLQGVGYPNPSQSHFRSMDIWQAADTAEQLTEGWLGRALKKLNCPAFHIKDGNESSPLAFNGAPAKVPSIGSLNDFQVRLNTTSGTDRADQRKILDGAAKPADKPNLLDFVQKTQQSTYAASDRLQSLSKNYEPKSPYPTSGLANRLKLVAQLIDANMGGRIFHVSLDGFDTHAAQGGEIGAHANLLRDVSEAIAAFYKDMSARGHKDRLMIMSFSEFGRRAKENGSKGTDHGSGAPMFLVGGKVKSGVIGAHPELDKLDDGNLKHHTDFRSVYAAILDEWLGVPSGEVIPGKFPQIRVTA